MKAHLTDKVTTRPAYVVLTNIVIFAFLYLAIVSSFWTSIFIIAFIVAATIFLEHKGLFDVIYEAYAAHMKLAYISVIILIMIFPFAIAKNSYIVHIAIMACLYATMALGLNFQMGSTDMVNFAPAAFFGSGAYASALLVVKLGVSPWFSLLIAILIATALGYIIGLPTLKTKGFYLSLVTIAMQTIFTLWIINTDWLGGPNGIAAIPSYAIGSYSFRSPLVILGIKFPYQVHFYFLAVIILFMAAVVAARLHNSRIGLSWNAIAGDDIAAKCQGINLQKTKLLAFCIGASFTGAAGAIYAHYMSFIGPQDFDFLKSLIIIVMVILGGMDNTIGVICGAVLLTLIDEKLRDFADYRMLIYGGILMVVLLIRPAGLIPKRIRRYVKPLLMLNPSSENIAANKTSKNR